MNGILNGIFEFIENESINLKRSWIQLIALRKNIQNQNYLIKKIKENGIEL